MRASHSLLLLALAPFLAGAIRSTPNEGVQAFNDGQGGDWPTGGGDWPSGGGDWPSGGGDWPGPPDDDKDDPATHLPVTSGKVINLHAERTGSYCNVDDRSDELRCGEDTPVDANEGLLIIGNDYMTQKIVSGDTVFVKSQRSNKFCAAKPQSRSKAQSPVICEEMMSGPTTEFVLLRAKHHDESAVFLVPKAMPDHKCAPTGASPYSMSCSRSNTRRQSVLTISDAGGSWGPPPVQEGQESSSEADDTDFVAESAIPMDDGSVIRIFWEDMEWEQQQPQEGEVDTYSYLYYSAEPMDSGDSQDYYTYSEDTLSDSSLDSGDFQGGDDMYGEEDSMYDLGNYEESENGHHGDPYDASDYSSYDEDTLFEDEDAWAYGDSFSPEEFEGGDSSDDDREVEAILAAMLGQGRLEGESSSSDDDESSWSNDDDSSSSGDDELHFHDSIIDMKGLDEERIDDFFEPYFSDDGDEDASVTAVERIDDFDDHEASSSDFDDHEASSSDDDDHEASSGDDDDHEASSGDDDDHEAFSSDDDDHEAFSSDDDDHEASSSDDDDHEASSSDDDDREASSSDDDDREASSSDDDDREASTSDDDDLEGSSSDDDDHEASSSDDDDESSDDDDDSSDGDDDLRHKVAARKHRHDLPNPTGAASTKPAGMVQSVVRAMQHAWARLRAALA